MTGSNLVAFPAADPLQHALIRLRVALAEQAQAIARWQGELAALRVATGDLAAHLGEVAVALAEAASPAGDPATLEMATGTILGITLGTIGDAC